jgi:hypothetical protein
MTAARLIHSLTNQYWTTPIHLWEYFGTLKKLQAQPEKEADNRWVDLIVVMTAVHWAAMMVAL